VIQEIFQETVTFRHTTRDLALPLQHGWFQSGSMGGQPRERWSSLSHPCISGVLPLPVAAMLLPVINGRRKLRSGGWVGCREMRDVPQAANFRDTDRLYDGVQPKEITPSAGLEQDGTIRYPSTRIQSGTILAGNPARSVVNMYCQHWQVSNLFTLGASAFPQNPSGNPTLTAVAPPANRTADAVIERYLKNPGALV
jgi:hypothetical protein